MPWTTIGPKEQHLNQLKTISAITIKTSLHNTSVELLFKISLCRAHDTGDYTRAGGEAATAKAVDSLAKDVR